MSYYRVDPGIFQDAQGSREAAALCSPLINALHALRNVRTDTCGLPGDWVPALALATERALTLFGMHLREASAQRSALREAASAAPFALAALTAEHAGIRSHLEMQRDLAAQPASRCASGAVRLLDIAVDTECLLAIHINGLATLLRETAQRTTSTPVTNPGRAGPQKIGVPV